MEKPIRCGRLARAGLYALCAAAMIACVPGVLLAGVLLLLGGMGLALGLGNAVMMCLSTSGIAAVIAVSVLSMRILMQVTELSADWLGGGLWSETAEALERVARCSAACVLVLLATQAVWRMLTRGAFLEGFLDMAAAFAAGYAVLAALSALLHRAALRRCAAIAKASAV